MKQANAYKPEQGTAPYIAVEYFRANPDTELSSAKLAEMLKVDVKNIAGTLAIPVSYGILAKRREGRACYYSLGNGVAPAERGYAVPAPAPAPAPVPHGLTCALYNDGELFVTGAQVTEEGVLFNRAQALELHNYLMRTGGLIVSMACSGGAA